MGILFAKILYRYIIFPLIFIGAHIYALFSSRIRRGLFPRYQSVSDMTQWIEKNHPRNKIILFHAASLGEFEHIKPLLYHFKTDFSTINIVTFFSPSGYQHVNKSDDLDFFIYMPFDTRNNWIKIYNLLKPELIIVAKHDVWPNHIWTAQELKIPIYLINASLTENSTRTRPLVRNFLQAVHQAFDKIFAISEEDGQRFEISYPGSKVEVIGDTKYDQVVYRKKAAEKQKLLPATWGNKRFTIIAGSTWPEDEEHLFPALKNIIINHDFVNLILIPHQPDDKAIRAQLNYFKDWEIALFSNREQIGSKRIIVIDVVGYLASLYYYANAAYVGGSFRQGVHNIMEPAIFGIPVLYGPVHKNSYEAIKLAQQHGGIIVNNAAEIQNWFEKFIKDSDLCKAIGEQVEKFVLSNTGATKRLLDNWKHIISRRIP